MALTSGKRNVGKKLDSLVKPENDKEPRAKSQVSRTRKQVLPHYGIHDSPIYYNPNDKSG
jgi:hypothetical protein